MLVLTKGVGKHTILGTTLDDAMGEAFDKVARMLQLPWLPQGGGAGSFSCSSNDIPILNFLLIPFIGCGSIDTCTLKSCFDL
jgi:N6-L-threonylcarbamoyladenine synthase